jgi:phospholipase/lecithinase/hemolysin
LLVFAPPLLPYDETILSAMMLRSLSLAVVAIAALSSGAEAKAWPFGTNIKNLVQFGDSYTGETNRLR